MSNDDGTAVEALEKFTQLAPESLPEAFQTSLSLALGYGVFGLTKDLIGLPRELLQQARQNIAASGDRNRQLKQRNFELSEIAELETRARLAEQARTARAQMNRESLVVQVLDLISDTESLREVDLSQSTPPSEHWLGHFWNLCAGVADSELRDTFARLLVGQISRPKSVSVATLNAVADLDAPTADRFRRLVACAIRPANGSLPFIVHPEPYSFLDYGNTESLDLEHEDLIRLDAAGLLTSWRSAVVQFTPDTDSEVVRVGNEAFDFDRAGRQFNLIYLSQVGAELAELVVVAPNRDFTDAIEALTPSS